MINREMELLLKFRDASLVLEKYDEGKKTAQAEYERAEAELIDYLQEKGATSTAVYDGVGSAVLPKPRLFASFLKENEATVFDFVKSCNEGELIKQTIPSPSLSSFVGRLIEDGKEVPGYISIFYKQSAKLKK